MVPMESTAVAYLIAQYTISKDNPDRHEHYVDIIRNEAFKEGSSTHWAYRFNDTDQEKLVVDFSAHIHHHVADLGLAELLNKVSNVFCWVSPKSFKLEVSAQNAEEYLASCQT